MSVNKYKAHVLILPEDDANRELALGFMLNSAVKTKAIEVLQSAGGWHEALTKLNRNHAADMRRFPHRHMVILIDFDSDSNRHATATARIPADLKDRVYIVGAFKEPEDLKRDLGSFESIGEALARDCRHDTNATWGHPLLAHNAAELDRLRSQVRPILFPEA